MVPKMLWFPCTMMWTSARPEVWFQICSGVVQGPREVPGKQSRGARSEPRGPVAHHVFALADFRREKADYGCSTPDWYPSRTVFYHRNCPLLLFSVCSCVGRRKGCSASVFSHFFKHFLVLFLVSFFIPAILQYLAISEKDLTNAKLKETVTLHQMNEHWTGSSSFDSNKNCDLRKSLLPWAIDSWSGKWGWTALCGCCQH